MTFIYILVGLLIGVFCIAFFFTILVSATRAFRPKLINGLPNFAIENITFRNRRQQTLRGWWHEGDADKPVIVVCHGVGGNRGDLNPLTNRLAARGFSMLLFDFHGHGESDGYKTSFGHLEKYDLLAALEYLHGSERLKNRPLCFFGLSMGAATISLTAPEIKKSSFREQLQPVAVVLDSSFARFAPIIRRIAIDWPPIARVLFLPLVHLVGDYIFQVPSLVINPERRIAQLNPARLLIIHNHADELIPFEHAERLHAAALPPKELWALDGALHGENFLHFGQTYADKVANFFLNA